MKKYYLIAYHDNVSKRVFNSAIDMSPIKWVERAQKYELALISYHAITKEEYFDFNKNTNI